jgi:hypothetical protein
VTSTTERGKPFDASFRTSERFTPHEDQRCLVLVAETPCEGVIAGSNGPRTQVRFRLDGASYLRWFDSADVQLAG